MDEFHTVEYYSAIKRKPILLFVTTWLNLEDIMLNEVRQTKITLYGLVSLVCEL